MRPFFNFLRRHLEHDLREVVLIVIGVLVALAANAWWQGRQDRKDEIELLAEMRKPLAEDLTDLRESAAGLHQTDSTIARLQALLRSGAPYSPHMDTLFGGAYRNGGESRPNVAVYEALRARGLELVQNDSLRYQIIRVYDLATPWLLNVNDINRRVNWDVMRPYFLTHFRDLQPGSYARPIDYDAVAHDPYFDNLLTYRRSNLGLNVAAMYDTAVVDFAKLQRMLDAELARRR